MTAPSLIVGTAGHIDHGKTALVRALTGIETDRLEQEQRRGISIDIGFAHLDVNGRRLGIVDVPGHERFIKNMLAGASGIDLAILVIAADDSVMPQTREHLAILELLGVRHGLIVITKTDLVDDAWRDLVEQDARELVAETFLANAPIVMTSAVTGAGLDTLRNELDRACAVIDAPAVDEPFRMAIDRSFVLQGLGTVVTGTVWSGALEAGDEVHWLPANRAVRVRGMQSHGHETTRLARGQRAALNVSGVHHSEIRRGHELAAPGFLRTANAITVRLQALPDSPWSIRHRSRVRLHLGTGEMIAGVRLLEGTTIAPGERGLARLTCAEPVVARARQAFVVRAESPLRTIGGGVVLQPTASRIARRNAESRTRLRELDHTDDLVRAGAAVWFAGFEPWDALDLCRDAALDHVAAGRVSNELTSAGVVTAPLAGRRLHRDRHARLRRTILDAVNALHAAAPLEAALPRPRLLSRLGYLPEDLVTACVDQAIADGELVGGTAAIAATNFRPTLSSAQARLHASVLEAFSEAGYKPPECSALAQALSVTEAQLRPILDLCAAEGMLVHVGAGMYLHRDQEQELRRRLRDRLRDSDGLTAGEIKTVIGTTRKYAMPICEYLDRVGVTRRVGDVRVLVEDGRG